MAIKNIIFDLGGVIIDLHYAKTLQAFHDLGVENFEQIYSQEKQTMLCDDFETGKISADVFRSSIIDALNISLNKQDFDNAWNAMLGDLPKEKLDFLKILRKKYKLFLFSNTNEIHIKQVFNICKEKLNCEGFKDCFEREYYSHILGHRKPNKEAFICILKENNLKPNETLFIDDTLMHVEGARSAGLHAIHLNGNKSIFEVEDYISGISNMSS